MADARIVVLGAGVAGLTTALLLSRNPKYIVTVVAKHMPGDYDIEYTSPWAGANYLPVSVRGTRAAEWDKNTWPELKHLARDVPESGIHFQTTVLHSSADDPEAAAVLSGSELFSPQPWWKDVVPDFRELSSRELPAGMKTGTTFTSVCINTALYLPWLALQCVKNGAVLQRGVLEHISEAKDLHHSGKPADLVVNCTGLLASRLGGVEDKTIVPVRGQIVLVRNDPGVMYSSSSSGGAADEVVYVMKRAAGGGTILGGCRQEGNWDSQYDPNLAQRIMKRAVEACPALTDGKGVEALDVIRHGVGLRPYRPGGVRLEKENIGSTLVVHNYGHSGFGYQSSYGCSQEVVRLVDETIKSKAKL